MEFTVKEKLKPLSDWKLWYKLFFGLSIIGIVLYLWLDSMIKTTKAVNLVQEFLEANTSITLENLWEQINEHFADNRNVMKSLKWLSIGPDFNQIEDVVDWEVSAAFGDITIYTFSFFTNLSNIAVAIWFIYAAIRPKREGQIGFLSFGPTIIVVTYITVTLLVYNLVLLPAIAASEDISQWTASYWFSTLWLHLIAPASFIAYVLIWYRPKEIMTTYEYMTKGWWKQISLLIIYAIYILIRGELRYRGGKPNETAYPYFFFWIHESNVLGTGLPGGVWFLIAILIISGITMLFSYLYVKILNWKTF